MSVKERIRMKEVGDSYRAVVNDKELDEETVKNAFQTVEKGTTLRRVRRFKLQPAVLVQLSPEHDFLIYKTPTRCVGGGKTKRVPVSMVIDVRIGWNTDRFMKAATKTKFNTKVRESCCFSVVFRHLQEFHKSMDFVTNTPEERDHWFMALHQLMLEMRAAALHFNEETWLKRHYQEADENNNGKLSFNEVWELLKKLGVQIPRNECRRLFLLSDINKEEDLDSPALNFNEFVLFFRSLTKRPELKKVMRSYSKQGIDLWTADDLKKFLEESQGFQVTLDECKAIIKEFEPDNEVRRGGHLCVHGFRLLLLSKWGSLIRLLHSTTVFQDMNQPICHYFINSSHNTYLLGHQLRGNATIEGYILALKIGARLLELDIWEGDDEPVVTHGYTLVNAVRLVNIVRAIDTYAFVTSPYPLILSLENHCSLEFQVKTAHIFAKIFGDKIYVPDPSQTVLPSPEQLKNRILLKCKKLSDHTCAANKTVNAEDDDEFFDDVYDTVFGLSDSSGTSPKTEEPKPSAKKKNEKVPIAHEFSDLIALKATKLRDFGQDAKEHGWNSHVSLTEGKAKGLLEKELDVAMYYTANHLVKVYPSGKRTDSTNMPPHYFWIAGIQHVTMNAQTAGEELDLNNGLFSINDACGYVLKPKWMRQGSFARYYDLAKRPTQMMLRVQIISGHCLPKPDTKYSESIVDPYVTIEIFGFPFDNQKYKTGIVQSNGFNPVWNSDQCVIRLKVPEIALLRFCVKDYDRISANDFIGQYTIPVMSITQGYSHVPLFTGSNHSPDPSAAIFVRIEIECALSDEDLTSAK